MDTKISIRLYEKRKQMLAMDFINPIKWPPPIFDNWPE